MKAPTPSRPKKSSTGKSLTAKQFIQKLSLSKSAAEIAKIERFFSDGEASGNKCLGVRWSIVFNLAKEFMLMEPDEIEELLESKYYEARMGAVSIMDFQARHKKTTAARKKELFDLYIRRHDRINNWDLVDRSAPYVVGGYLFDKPRALLFKLAKSKNVWERRTAIVSTYYFIRQGEVEDTFSIAQLLLNDKHNLIHKAAGSWVREAGKKDRQRLLTFLNNHSQKMPRTMLRYAIEQLEPKQRALYMAKKA